MFSIVGLLGVLFSHNVASVWHTLSVHIDAVMLCSYALHVCVLRRSGNEISQDNIEFVEEARHQQTDPHPDTGTTSRVSCFVLKLFLI